MPEPDKHEEAKKQEGTLKDPAITEIPETGQDSKIADEAGENSITPEPEKKPGTAYHIFSRLFSIILMLLFSILSGLLAHDKIRFEPISAKVLGRTPVLPYYLAFIHYPKGSVVNYGLAVFLFLIVIYLGLDLLIFSSLKGWKKALCVIVSIILIMVGTESAMSYYSWIDPEMHRPHPTLFWELSPNLVRLEAGEDVQTNSHGFRSPEISVKKPAGQIRVMILGDSSAFGFRIKDRQTFGAHLVKMLRQKYKGEDIVLLNTSVAGWTTYQAKIFMKERGWKFSPDIIIIAFNDDGQSEWKEDVERAPAPVLIPFLRVLYKSNIYLSIKKLVINSQIKKDPSFTFWPKERQGKSRVSPEQLRKNIGEIFVEAKKRGSKAIVISMPMQSPGGRQHRFQMKQAAQDAGYVFMDFQDGFRQYPSTEVFQDVMHPTAKGHEIIAENLFKIIVDEKWLEKNTK